MMSGIIKLTDDFGDVVVQNKYTSYHDINRIKTMWGKIYRHHYREENVIIEKDNSRPKEKYVKPKVDNRKIGATGRSHVTRFSYKGRDWSTE